MLESPGLRVKEKTVMGEERAVQQGVYSRLPLDLSMALIGAAKQEGADHGADLNIYPPAIW